MPKDYWRYRGCAPSSRPVRSRGYMQCCSVCDVGPRHRGLAYRPRAPSPLTKMNASLKAFGSRSGYTLFGSHPELAHCGEGVTAFKSAELASSRADDLPGDRIKIDCRPPRVVSVKFAVNARLWMTPGPGGHFLTRGHLFAIEHAPARLADHPCAEIAIMRDLLAQGLITVRKMV